MKPANIAKVLRKKLPTFFLLQSISMAIQQGNCHITLTPSSRFLAGESSDHGKHTGFAPESVGFSSNKGTSDSRRIKAMSFL